MGRNLESNPCFYELYVSFRCGELTPKFFTLSEKKLYSMTSNVNLVVNAELKAKRKKTAVYYFKTLPQRLPKVLRKDTKISQDNRYSIRNLSNMYQA
jgi:hypothetical protein